MLSNSHEAMQEAARIVHDALSDNPPPIVLKATCDRCGAPDATVARRDMEVRPHTLCDKCGVHSSTDAERGEALARGIAEAMQRHLIRMSQVFRVTAGPGSKMADAPVAQIFMTDPMPPESRHDGG